MAIEVGNIVDGTVSGITKFGVFVDLGEKQTGLVHISEVAHGYVEDINTVLKVEDPVKVRFYLLKVIKSAFLFVKHNLKRQQVKSDVLVVFNLNKAQRLLKPK